MASKLAIPSLLAAFFLLLSSPTPLYASVARGCNKDDQAALLAIKAAFNNDDYFASWDSSASSCCTWLGIDCEPKRGRVSGLTIVGRNISGTLPPAIADIRFLKELEMYDLPNLVGPIPPAFAKFKNILLLRVQNTSISGTIPAFLGQLTTLGLLDLSFNRLSGTIPATLSSPPNLHYIHLDHNQLTGPIPDSFGSFGKIPYLELNVSHNALSGPLPTSFGKPDWSILDLSMNQLTGDASSLLVSSKPAIVIDLSMNRLNFDLSGVTFPENLTILDLSHNRIYGGIPAQINQLTDLGAQFNVSYNQLCGQIPAGAVTAQCDQYSFLHNKCLCGAPLPPAEALAPSSSFTASPRPSPSPPRPLLMSLWTSNHSKNHGKSRPNSTGPVLFNVSYNRLGENPVGSVPARVELPLAISFLPYLLQDFPSCV